MVELNPLFQKDQGKTASTARIHYYYYRLFTAIDSLYYTIFFTQSQSYEQLYITEVKTKDKKTCDGRKEYRGKNTLAS